MYERLLALETFGIKLGLDNITTLCAALGHPERRYSTLHVAGTNGKGSVTAMVHAALGAANLRAARYTSPHLVGLEERFVVGDSPVRPDELDAVASDVLDRADELRRDGALAVHPTFFEAATATAFELFRRQAVDVAVIEVGMGGRFDATNIITPVAGAITTVSIDHQQYLGHTLGEIAFEKAGILKSGVPFVVGELPPEALHVVRGVAAERGAVLAETASDTRVEVEMQDGRARLSVQTPRASYGPLRLSLRGEHQVGNAVVAIRLLEAASGGGLTIERTAIEQGLSSAQWPARLELFTLATGQRVLLDAAHNRQGAEALAAYLRRWHPERPVLVLGMSRDKDADDIVAALAPAVSRVIATQAPAARALDAADLADRVRARGVEVRAEADPHAAVMMALDGADTTCIAGSIFLAGAVRGMLDQLK